MGTEKGNTGYSNTGSYNVGSYNIGNYNTGDYNTGDWNTGDYNTGNCNTGDYNIGNYNAGNWNAGDNNTGNRNAGNCNTGTWNTGNYNTGCFNTITPDIILVFNKMCERDEWETKEKPDFIYFDLIDWINEEDMTDEEKRKYPEYKTTGGYLKKYEYKEAFQKSFNELSSKEKKRQVKQLKALPNFDKDIFFEISGIDIDKIEPKKMTLKEICEELGYDVEIIKEEN